MANGPEHALVASIAVGGIHALVEMEKEQPTLAPIGTAVVASYLGSIPDWLEPAVHPNHRQICHSVAAGAAVAYCAHKIYKWQPKMAEERFLRWFLLVAGGCYLVHLLMDASTAKSIPLVGKLQ